jgi:hypothetical protein
MIRVGVTLEYDRFRADLPIPLTAPAREIVECILQI